VNLLKLAIIRARAGRKSIKIARVLHSL